ncbi:MAG: alcohol dehydrogenase catalytic domain-containing protein [Chloroflexi bacterium]|nr:alcohol dehydrogenase catalytic domain-containing protein [Chloroflexota bacterium]
MKTMKMKAAVWHKPMDLSVEEVEKPTVGDGDVLVKVRACGICGSDLQLYKEGAHPEIGIPVASGLVPGHEYVGDVVEMGSKVKMPGLKVGDRILTVGAFGAMAEYIRLTAESLPLLLGLVFKVPAEVSDEEAATVEPLIPSLAGMVRGKPAAGETVVVMGCGPVGLGLVQCLKALTSTRVIATAWSSKKRLALARQFGADVTIMASEEDPYEKVLAVAGAVPAWGVEKQPAAVDIVYDCAGHPAKSPRTPAIQQGLWMLRPNTGRLVEISGFEGTVELDLMPVVQKTLNIYGSMDATPDLMKWCIELIRTKKVDRKAMISHVFPLDKAKEAFEIGLNDKGAVKVMIKP